VGGVPPKARTSAVQLGSVGPRSTGPRVPPCRGAAYDALRLAFAAWVPRLHGAYASGPVPAATVSVCAHRLESCCGCSRRFGLRSRCLCPRRCSRGATSCPRSRGVARPGAEPLRGGADGRRMAGVGRDLRQHGARRPERAPCEPVGRPRVSALLNARRPLIELAVREIGRFSTPAASEVRRILQLLGDDPWPERLKDVPCAPRSSITITSRS
jgi:hypothetical protein